MKAHFRLTRAAMVAALMLVVNGSRPLSAQVPQPPQTPPVPQQEKPPQADPQTPPSTGPQHRRRPAALPKTPAEREKALSDLYALLATADDEDSAKVITEAIERIWDHSGSATIDVLMQRSAKAVAEKKYDLAQKFLDYIVELAPDFTEGWNRRAYVHFMRNDVDHALGDLRRALALDPNHFKALDGLAHILRDIGQKRPALQAFRQLLEVHPFWSGAEQAVRELTREVEGQGI